MQRLMSTPSFALRGASSSRVKGCLSTTTTALLVTSSSCCLHAQLRGFDTGGRIKDEYGFANKMRDITVVTGSPKPTSKEGDWVCKYHGTDRMMVVVKEILEAHDWSEAEVTRELDEMFAQTKLARGAQYACWKTVEEFQRTPWYRRFRPNDTSGTHFCSIECMKLLESELIPPSHRKDPYVHLRKRHYEDNFVNERYSEDAARHITRAGLAERTPGMPQNKLGGRAKFLQFDKEYREKSGGTRFIPKDEVYAAWMQAQQQERAGIVDDDI